MKGLPVRQDNQATGGEQNDFDRSLLKDVAACPPCEDRIVWQRTIAVHLRSTHLLSGLAFKEMCAKMNNSVETVLMKSQVVKGVRMNSSMIERRINKSTRRLVAEAATASQLSELDPDACSCG